MMPGGTTIAFCAMNDRSTDTSIAAESEGAVLNGLLGRLLVEYWWPEAEIPAGLILDSPFARAGAPRA
jgi:beta-lactamase class A